MEVQARRPSMISCEEKPGVSYGRSAVSFLFLFKTKCVFNLSEQAFAAVRLLQSACQGNLLQNTRVGEREIKLAGVFNSLSKGAISRSHRQGRKVINQKREATAVCWLQFGWRRVAQPWSIV